MHLSRNFVVKKHLPLWSGKKTTNTQPIDSHILIPDGRVPCFPPPIVLDTNSVPRRFRMRKRVSKKTSLQNSFLPCMLGRQHSCSSCSCGRHKTVLVSHSMTLTDVKYSYIRLHFTFCVFLSKKNMLEASEPRSFFHGNRIFPQVKDAREKSAFLSSEAAQTPSCRSSVLTATSQPELTEADERPICRPDAARRAQPSLVALCLFLFSRRNKFAPSCNVRFLAAHNDVPDCQTWQNV